MLKIQHNIQLSTNEIGKHQLTWFVQGKERSFKRRLPQHNKPTHPNNEVPPQDAQLQGVVLMASTRQAQTRSASKGCATSRGTS